MRFIPMLLIALAVTGCDLADSSQTKPVDASTLAPLSSKEQALIFGADGAMQQGNYAAAERDYMSAVAASTGHVDAHIALARLYEKQHASDKEQAVLQRALELQPNHPLVNYMLGKLYLEDFRNAEALTAFQHGRITRPNDIDLSIGEAVTNDMLGKHGDAQRIYARILTQNTQADLTNVRTNLAMSFLLSGEPKEAVELLKDEVKKPNVSTVTRHNLALAYGMLGRNAEAKQLLNGEVDEETRQLTIARMKEYLAERDSDTHTPPLQPTITPAGGPELTVSPGDLASVPAKPVTKEAKPAPAKAKPVVPIVKVEKAAPKSAEKPAEPAPAKPVDKVE